MKSLNKYVPTIVFLVGLALLIFSVRTFFHPGAFTHMTPIVNSATDKGNRPAVQQAPAVLFRPLKQGPAVVSRTDPRDELDKIRKRAAENYLRKVGLKMTLPAGFAFVEETDGPVNVLIGAAEAGKPDFYMFSAKGKYKIDRVNQYLKEYFADEMTVTPKGGGSSVHSRGGFADMTHLKGATSRGEYQAFFFSNAKSNQSHLLFLMDKKILKAPARVRELVDSIGRAGR